MNRKPKERREWKTPEPIKKPRGNGTFRCNMSRHLGNLRLIGAYETILRLTNAAEIEKANRDLSPDNRRHPLLYAGKATIADAIGCSINTASSLIHDLVSLDILVPLASSGRTERGKFEPRDYEVMLHDDVAQYDPCPPYRFERSDGRLKSVKDGLRKQDPSRADRFSVPEAIDSETWESTGVY